MAIKFYIDNWLMAVSAVGFAKVLEHAGVDPLQFFKERTIEVPEKVWERVAHFYTSYLLKDFDSFVKPLYEALSAKKEVKWSDIKNPYNQVVLSRLGDFYKNSPLTNQAKGYIREVAEKNEETIRSYSEDLKEAIQNLLSRWDQYSKTISTHISLAIEKAFREILSATSQDGSPICFFCKERPSYRTFDAVNFTPLSASPETLPNFFYNCRNTMYLCKECEILLYFACFGFTRVNNRYLFVYMPDDIEKMLSVNRLVEERKWLSWDIVKESLVEVAKVVEGYKAEWTLKNIYVVEVQPAGEAKSNIHTFSLRPELAKALKERIEKYPPSLEPFFDLFLNYVYQGKSLYEMLYRILAGYFFRDRYKNINISTYEGRLVSFGSKGLWCNLLYLIKFQEVLNMQTNKDKEINWAFFEGRKLAEAYSISMGENRAKKKIETLSYRLLEAIRRKDIDHFSQNIIRAYLEVEKPVPQVFVNALKEGGLERIAYAFLIGLNGKEARGGPEEEIEPSLGKE